VRGLWRALCREPRCAEGVACDSAATRASGNWTVVMCQRIRKCGCAAHEHRTIGDGVGDPRSEARGAGRLARARLRMRVAGRRARMRADRFGGTWCWIMTEGEA
jgi:hypothetical protein